MTFEQWFEANLYEKMMLLPMLHRYSYEQAAQQAWEAGYEAGGREQVEWQDYLDRYDD